MVVDLNKAKSKIGPHGMPIVKCPKCGRRGERRELEYRGRSWTAYDHVVDPDGIGYVVKEYCSVMASKEKN